MCMKKNVRSHDLYGQSIMEYASLIALVVVVFLVMGTYIRRGIQGLVKVTADQLGNQRNAEQTFDERGHLINSLTITRAKIDKESREQFGVFNYIYNDRIETDSFTALNAGFTPRQN